jgi:signal transduction histidine kinase
MRKGMELGADDYLVKPFSRIDLINAVKVRLERANELQNQIKELKSNILYSVPHELQTPLNVIIGFSKSMKEDFDTLSIEDVTEMSRAIYDSGIRLSSTINKFLMLINVELNGPEKTFAKLLLTQSDMAALAQNIAQKYSRTDDLVLKCPDIELTVIKEWLLFALCELIDNAFKFSCHDGKVIITGEKVKNKIRISISDHGIGFPSGVMEKIYAFTQFDRKIYEQQGTGLGLFLAKTIINLHRGEILIESTQKIGSNIIIDLPQ